MCPLRGRQGLRGSISYIVRGSDAMYSFRICKQTHTPLADVCWRQMCFQSGVADSHSELSCKAHMINVTCIPFWKGGGGVGGERSVLCGNGGSNTFMKIDGSDAFSACS